MNYTPRQVSVMLNIPASTLRRYASRFASHLSQAARAGRSRKYSDSDIVVLNKIRQLSNSGHSPDEIEKLLPLESGDLPPPNVSLALLPQIETQFEQLRSAGAGLRQDLNETRDEVRREREERLSDRELLDNALERIERIESRFERELREYNELPWWRKIGRRRPQPPIK